MATSADDLTTREVVAIGRLLFEGVSRRVLAKAFGVSTEVIEQAEMLRLQHLREAV